MKIINGHDYYDGAGWGVDPDIVFVRNEPAVDDFPVHLHDPFEFSHRRFSVDDKDRKFHFPIVLVGRNIFPIMICETNPGLGETIYHDKQSALDAVDALFKKSARQQYVSFRSPDLKSVIDAHFTPSESFRKKITDWMISNHVVTGVITREHMSRDDSVGVRVNGAFLSDFEIYKLLDPATAHMEISSWIGGVLPHSPDTMDLTDESRLEKAGFDRHSFRQDPGVKKPRRKRKVTR